MQEALEAGRHLSGYALLGRTGLTVSGIGFGAYRIRESEDEHRRALAQALAAGCNLLDTSTNYGDGSSERLVGQVLPKEMDRDGVVVVSKVGYVQGRNLTEAKQRLADGNPYPEMVRYSDRCWHCIHPEFLEAQITASLERMQLSCVDVMLLHNPEYFLMDRARNPGAMSLEQRRDVYYRRVAHAFEFLEAQVSAGRIAHYGVSSNTFVVDPGRGDF
ncbi:MAG: aryl-alcohol dehydrogenase-like predicted oxidoreductase, partial [Myxococcota bacterium]